MKAFSLLSSLTPTEKKAFEVVIKNKGRNSLFNLYSYLKKASLAKLEKPIIFKATFTEQYTKEKDYLLRNELRLLTNALRQFITEREWEKASLENPHFSNYWYLKALLSRKLNEVYDAEYTDIYEAANSNLQLQIKMDLSLDHINRISQDLAKTLGFDDILLEAELFRQNLRELAAYKNRVYEHHRMAMEGNRDRMGMSTKLTLTPFAYSQSLDIGPTADTVLSKYYHYITKSNTTNSNDGITYLEQAVQLIENIKPTGIDTHSLKTTCYNNLCILLQEQEDYETAKKYGKKAFEISLPDGRFLGVIFGNYLRILLKTGNIKEARKLFHQYKEQFSDPINFPNILSAMIEGEITVGDVDIAMDLLQDMITRSKINYFTVKTCFIAAYYRKKEFALADNEITNIFQYMRDNEAQGYNIEQEPYFFPLRQLIKLQRQPTVSQKDVEKLAELYNALPQEMKVVHRRSVLLPWIYEQIENFIKEKGSK